MPAYSSKVLPAVIVAAILLFSACKKKDDPPAQQIDTIVYPSYSRLAPGNYWVYEAFELDSNYNTLYSKQITDSFYVDKDTVIAGQTYYKYWQPEDIGSGNHYSRFLRDSLQYIVDNFGNIFFASQDFSTVFYRAYRTDPSHVIAPVDTPYRLERKMADKDKSVATPAGTYITSSWQTVFYMDPFFAQYGPVVRRLNNRYAAGIGMVAQTIPFYAADPDYVERRLLRYHLQ